MDAFTLSVTIREDRRLIIDLPPDVPLGIAELTIKPHASTEIPPVNTARETARAKLLAAGKLVTDIRAPEGTYPLTPEEILRLGTLPPGSPSLDELIDEDRGPR